ncbi:MAG: CocE/NonD family hydrolase [Bacteroidetes bacterium]|nr:CocE/NonD family hydrolase [Bacteroidota bacterium]
MLEVRGSTSNFKLQTSDSKRLFCISLISLFPYFLIPSSAQDSAWTVNNYYKMERMLPMRDGVKLFTSIYIPKDSSTKHPIMLTRTPYSCAPYGSAKFRDLWTRNTRVYLKEKYIIVIQDVRGRYMSEGEFEDIRPYNPKAHSSPNGGGQEGAVDEASDTYDAIDWLIKNIPTSNGNVGVSGISYPGFYSTMAALSGHPALKAVSPQAPVTDWFIGDDVHHKGAFFVMDDFDFDYFFGQPRPKPTSQDAKGFEYPTEDNYDFFLREGTLKNLTKHYMGDTMKFWQQEMNHSNYDEFWKKHTVTYSLYSVKPAMLLTGGLFDAEDLWGTWNVYKTIEKQSPSTVNKICMGPWSHGGWAKGDGSKLGNVQFGSKTSEWYFQNVELPFFNYYLKGENVPLNKGGKSEGQGDIPAEATIFITGENKWKTFSEWPPKNSEEKKIYLGEKDELSFTKPSAEKGFSEYVSDPAHPVPYTEDVHLHRTTAYMSDDQRFASRRSDVITFKTEPLKEEITLTGPVIADLFVSISTTDADFVVKLIDVFPDDFKYDTLKTKVTHDNKRNPKKEYPMGGYQMLVRAEIMRGKFRNSFEKAEAFVPNQISEVKYELPDVAHTFQKGHRIMVQIQSSWFPLADRNPQQFCDIYHCDEKDFVKSTIRIYHDAKNASSLLLPVLKKQ